MVEADGIEPYWLAPIILNGRFDLNPTSVRAPIYIHQVNGGGGRDRTDDLLLAKQALSQLSYAPFMILEGKWWAWEDLNFRPHAYQARALTN